MIGGNFYEKTNAQTHQHPALPADGAVCFLRIDALTYDESIDYFENRARVSELTYNAITALQAQQQADYDASVTWMLLPTSADGLSKGDLYFDLDALEAASAARYADQKIYDLIPASNAGMAGLEALKKQYSAEWKAAYEQVIEEDHLVNGEGKIVFDDKEYTPEEYFAPERTDGYIIDADFYFEERIMELRPDLVSTTPWGTTQLDWEKLGKIGEAYVQEAYADAYEQAIAEGAQQASDEINELRAYDWYLNTTDYSGAKAMQNGATVSFDDPATVAEVYGTLTEVCTVCGKTIKQGEGIPATGDTTPDTPDTPDDSGDCPYSGKTHKQIWVKIIHLVLWFIRNVVRIFTK